HRALLEQVSEGDIVYLASLGGLQDEIEVVLDEPAVGGVAIRALGVEEASLFVVGQAWVTSELGSVIGLFVIDRSGLCALRHRFILRRPARSARAIIRS